MTEVLPLALKRELDFARVEIRPAASNRPILKLLPTPLDVVILKFSFFLLMLIFCTVTMVLENGKKWLKS